MPTKRITHCIFDMDGLLLDTERFYTVVSQQIASRYGKEFTWDIKSKQMGKKALESCQIFVDELGLQGQLTAEQLLIDREAALDALFPTAQLMPGAERLLRHLHAHNVPCALATGSNRRHYGAGRTGTSTAPLLSLFKGGRRHSTPPTELKTAQHAALFSLFQHVITGDEVSKGKPDPELFERAAAGFLPPPTAEACLVFEDAPSGVQAALGARMSVVMVPDAQLDPSLHAGAHLVLSSLQEFDPEAWGLAPFDRHASS